MPLASSPHALVCYCYLLLSLLLSSTYAQQQNNSDTPLPDLFCYGYIINKTTTALFQEAAPIPCSKQEFNDYGTRWGPPQHQSLSCCTGDGRYYVQTSQIGGLDVTFGREPVSPTCQAYASALRAVLCGPRQGQFIRPLPPGAFTPQPSSVPEILENKNGTNTTQNMTTLFPSASPTTNTTQNMTLFPSASPTTTFVPSMSPTEAPDPILTVCQSSCDAVFNACGLPGINFPESAQYTDGKLLLFFITNRSDCMLVAVMSCVKSLTTPHLFLLGKSLCLEAWGGFSYSSPCDKNPNGFPCTVNLQLAIEESDCLEIITPSNDVIDSYAEDRAPPVPAQCEMDQPVTVAQAVVYVVIVIAGVCAFLCIGMVGWIYCRRRQMDLQDAGEW